MSLSAGTSSWSAAHPESLVVGTVYSQSALDAAQALPGPPTAPDLLELRLDHFAGAPQALDALAAGSARPLIITVRSPDEGGYGDLDACQRRSLYERFLAAARYVDLELSSLAELAGVAEQARATPGGLIASYHDFHGSPSPEQLHELAGRASAAGAAILKIAVRAEHPSSLTVLLDFLCRETRLPLAIMGMGRFGRISRLLAAALGSRLNYGYLGEVEQVPGQWPVAVLRARLDELWQGVPPPPPGAVLSRESRVNRI